MKGTRRQLPAKALPAGFSHARRLNSARAVARSCAQHKLRKSLDYLRDATLRALARQAEEEAAAAAAPTPHPAKPTAKPSAAKAAPASDGLPTPPPAPAAFSGWGAPSKLGESTPAPLPAAKPAGGFQFQTGAFTGGFFGGAKVEAPKAVPFKAASATSADGSEDETPQLLSLARGMGAKRKEAEGGSPNLLMLSQQLKGRAAPPPMQLPQAGAAEAEAAAMAAAAAAAEAAVQQQSSADAERMNELYREIATLKTTCDAMQAEKAGVDSYIEHLKKESDELPRRYLEQISQLRVKLAEAEARPTSNASQPAAAAGPLRDENESLRAELKAARLRISQLQAPRDTVDLERKSEDLRKQLKQAEESLASEKEASRQRDARLNDELHAKTTELRSTKQKQSEEQCKAGREQRELRQQLRESADVTRAATRELLVLLNRLRGLRACSEDPRQMQEVDRVERRVKALQSNPAVAGEEGAADAAVEEQTRALKEEREASAQQAKALQEAQGEVAALGAKLAEAEKRAGEMQSVRQEADSLQAQLSAASADSKKQDLAEENEKLKQQVEFLYKEVDTFKGIFAEKEAKQRTIGELRQELHSAKKSAEKERRERVEVERSIPTGHGAVARPLTFASQETLPAAEGDDYTTPARRSRPTLKVPVMQANTDSSRTQPARADTLQLDVDGSQPSDDPPASPNAKRKREEEEQVEGGGAAPAADGAGEEGEDLEAPEPVRKLRRSLQEMIPESWSDEENEVLATKYLARLNDAYSEEERNEVFTSAAEELGKEAASVQRHMWANKEDLAEIAGLARRNTPRRPNRVIDADEEKQHFDDVESMLEGVEGDVDDNTHHLACTVLMELTGRSRSFVAGRI